MKKMRRAPRGAHRIFLKKQFLGFEKHVTRTVSMCAHFGSRILISLAIRSCGLDTWWHPPGGARGWVIPESCSQLGAPSIRAVSYVPMQASLELNKRWGGCPLPKEFPQSTHLERLHRAAEHSEPYASHLFQTEETFFSKTCDVHPGVRVALFSKNSLVPAVHSDLAMKYTISKRRNLFFKKMRCAPRGARRFFSIKSFPILKNMSHVRMHHLHERPFRL